MGGTTGPRKRPAKTTAPSRAATEATRRAMATGERSCSPSELASDVRKTAWTIGRP